MSAPERWYDPVNTPARQKILIKGNNKQYLDDIQKTLTDWIYYSYTGRAVLNAIFDSPAGTTLKIIQMSGKWDIELEDNLSTEDVDERLDGWALNSTPNQSDLTQKGTGKGCSAILYFDMITKVPSKFCSNGVCPNPKFNLPRFVLFHEMFHGMRIMTGKWQKNELSMLNGSSMDIEEATAILVTNILMSEKGEGDLRADHTTLTTQSGDAKTFVSNEQNRKVIDRIKRDHLTMYQKIQTLKNEYFTFNPFHEREQIR